MTLGPKGRNVVLDKKFGSPTITNDGVTIARDIELEDPFENMGAQLLKEVATKTDDVAGDGTTTAVVLGQALVTEGLKNVTAGANPMIVKRGMDKGVEAHRRGAQEERPPVDNREQIAAVAAISAADPEVGETSPRSWTRSARTASSPSRKGQSLGLEKEYTEGMQFDRGYISAVLRDQPRPDGGRSREPRHPDHRQEDLEHPGASAGAREGASSSASPLFIIAEDVDGEALATLVVNKLKGTISVLAVKAPGFGDRRKEMLRDMAILTRRQRHQRGARPQARLASPPRTSAARGAWSRPRTTRRSSTATAAADAIKGRMTQIKAQIEETTSDYDREKLQERLAKLAGGVAVIKVGAATEVELKEKKHRIEDALSTTRAAVEEGIVAGGGTALLQAIPALDELKLEGDETDRRQHRPPRARGARPARSPRTPARKAPSSSPPSRAEGRRGLRRPPRRVRRHVQEGHRRRRQGHAFSAAARSLDRGHGPDHGDAGHRQAGEEGRQSEPATATTTWTSNLTL